MHAGLRSGFVACVLAGLLAGACVGPGQKAAGGELGITPAGETAPAPSPTAGNALAALVGEDGISCAAAPEGEPTRLSPSCGQPTAFVASSTPAITLTRQPTASFTPQPTPSATATVTPTPSATRTPAPTSTPSATSVPTATLAPTAAAIAYAPIPPDSVRLAFIGDFGLANPREADVAGLVKGWRPNAIITLGDNNYPFGSAETVDFNVGQFYSDFIHPYRGAFGPGAAENRFFPALGNHDWQTEGAQPYLDFFTLPGNERYYEVRLGPVHLFVLDSQPDEPDGITVDSVQATWLRTALAASDAPWRLVTLHHPPYSSGPHGPLTQLRWPFAEWGATAVLSGHDHIYERIQRDGITYFVNGLGGTVLYEIGNPVEGSEVRYNEDFGAMLVEATLDQITFRFVTRAGAQVDEYTLTR